MPESAALAESLRGLLTAAKGLPPALLSLPLVFARPPPPLHDAEDEYVWLDSVEASEFVPLWDEDMVAGEDEESEETAPSTDLTSEAKDTDDKSCSSQSSPQRAPLATGEDIGEDWDPVLMLNKALTTQLMVNQASWLSERVREEPGLVAAVGMSAEKLPSLVEANPPVAVVVLLTLIADPNAAKDIATYLETLVCMEVTVHGMEVVNRLTSQVELPPAFMHIYISNCIAACDAIKDSSLAQNRLVRLVCVFLQALIRNRVITLADELHVELQAFCINFSRIKEAAALFKVVQSLGKESHPSTGAQASPASEID